jgi:hypothetical protein
MQLTTGKWSGNSIAAVMPTVTHLLKHTPELWQLVAEEECPRE